MNANEYFLISKMVEHLNVVHSYSLLLHEGTYNEIYRDEGYDLTIDLEQIQINMTRLLQQNQFQMYIAKEDLAQVVNSNSSLKSTCAEEASKL